jgi:hypothetical protein
LNDTKSAFADWGLGIVAVRQGPLQPLEPCEDAADPQRCRGVQSAKADFVSL